VSELAGWIGVGVFAALGSMLRFAIHTAVGKRVRGAFPFGTLLINVSGALALGLAAGAGVSGWALRLTGAALLGSYTTFSTWIFESGALAESGARRAAVFNLAGSVVLGFGAVAAGWGLGGLL
jgi:CrcB protein